MMTASSDRADEQHPWTFLSNYAQVLVVVAKNPDSTLREIAEQVGVTERAVHRIVTELEAVGVITRVREGRRNHYDIDTTLPMRHPLESDKTVGDLLGALLSRSEAATLGLRARGRRGTG
jgi:hypothetical protein